MISPFRFFWSRILPISYENYLSETEILEALRRKVNEVIVSVTKITEFIDSDLDGVIDQKVKDAIADYVTDISLQIKVINERIDDLDDDISYMSDALDSLKTRVKKNEDDIADIQLTLQKILSYLDAIDDLLDSIWSAIHRIEDNMQTGLKFNREYSDKQLSLARAEWVMLLSNMRKYLVRWVRKQFTELSGKTVYVYNSHGIRMTLQDWIDDIERQLSKATGGLTAEEFDALGLTAEEFDALGLTAWEFDNYGLDYNMYDDSDIIKLPDMFGTESANPVPSVYSAIANPIRTGDFDSLELSVDELDSLQYDSYSIDRWGEYLFKLCANDVSRETISGLVGFDSVELNGETYITSEVFAVSCGIGYDARGQILSEISVNAYHPQLEVTVDSQVGSEYTVIKNDSTLHILNKRLSTISKNTIVVEGTVKSDLTLRDNTLSFTNLPVLLHSSGDGLVVKATGNTRSNVIKI